MDDADDFERVGHTGGLVTFNIAGPSEHRSFAIQIQHASAGHAAAIFGITVASDFVPVSPLQMGGLVTTPPDTPPPVARFIPVYILSDKEGFIGRRCPRCTHYFRTHSHGAETTCPYCGARTGSHLFLSEGQRNYVRHYLEVLMSALESGQAATIDFNVINRQFEGNSGLPSPLDEQRQQTRFTCSACKNRADIAGRFGYCPSCGHRNSFAVLTAELNALDERVAKPRFEPEQREQRDGEWRGIVRDAVSAFEGFGRDLLAELSKLPAIPARRKMLGEVTFHRPLRAAQVLKELFGFDLLRGLDAEEQAFLERRFLRRHIYEHNAGLADEDYIRESGENVRVGQRIREKSSQVSTLLRLVKTMAENFDKDFHSMEHAPSERGE